MLLQLKVGDIVYYDGEKYTIIETYGEPDISPSGNLLIEDENGIRILIHQYQLD